MSGFVHLHVHSEYSMLDGLAKIDKLLKKVKDHGQTAIALTDHGGMYGSVAFHNACKKAGIKPIVGCELYVAQKSRTDKQIKMGSDQGHLTVLAKNHKGYQNLMHLVSIGNIEGFSYKPRIDDEVLEKYSEGLIVLSGCMGSVFNKLIRDKKIDLAKEKFKKYKKIFGDDFYVELQAHPSIPELKDLNKTLVSIAREFDLELVATNDVHYVEKHEAEAQDALLCVQTRKLISDDKRMKMVDNPDFYLRSTDEMKDLFTDYPEAIANTIKIAEKIDLTIPTGQLIFPKYPLPKGETAKSWLKKKVYEGLKKKFDKITPVMEKRLEYEMKIINDKGYPTYFLITQDFVTWAKDHGIRVGPGRGSVAGSLVSYCLDITTIDPLFHGLPFERFLNPERPTPPDIDIDFADDRREEVIQYAAEKYGKDHVANVITFGRMEARVSIRDIGRVLGMPYEDPDKISKLIPNHPGKKTSLSQAIAAVPELAEYYKQPKFRKLIDLAKQVEGTIRHSSVHAAAVIIADKPLPFYTPIQQDNKSGKTITQYDMYSLDCNIDDDAIGLLKFDFLGLRNLSTIQMAVKLIKKYKNIDLDIDNIPLDNKKTYKLLASGETTGIFQLESGGMRRVARSLQPSQFSDITAMLALYRPGPMDLIPRFIEGKHDPKSIQYPHDSLKDILGETYGIMVYQEQVLEIVHFMAGYTLGEADMLRRAIGKKKKKILDENKKRFVTESIKRDYKKETAEKVWGFIEAFANYGFNKAHAASYAMISYQTAYLKANYPIEYMAAMMTVESNSHSANRDEKVAVSIEASKQMKIKVLPPEINKSTNAFTIEKHENSLDGKAIRFSISAIKNIGHAAIANILEVRKKEGEFKSFTEFVNRTDGRKVNKKVLESLIKVGTMDKFGTRASMLENLESIRQTAAQYQSDVEGQDNLFADVTTASTDIQDTFPKIDEYPIKELLSFEKELLGMYLTGHPLADQMKAVTGRANIRIDELDQHIHKDKSFLFGGILSRIKVVRTKKTNKEMAFGTLQDETGSIEIVFFPRTYDEYKEDLVQDNVLLIKAKVDLNDDEVQLLAEKISVPKTSDAEYSTINNAQEIFVPRKTSPEVLKKLGTLLKSRKGETKILILIPNGEKPERMLLPYGVAWSKDLEKEVADLLR